MVKALKRELYGFILLRGNWGIEFKTLTRIDCQNGQYEIKYGYEEYNSEDKEIFHSDKHCLRYFYSFLLDSDFKEKYPTNNDCYNADLLKTSKDAGLKCGYSEFNLKYESGKSEVYKTCYIYNPDIINSKAFDDKSTEAFGTYTWNIASVEGETLMSYTVEMSDDSGNKISYDSLTNQVTIPSSSKRRRSSSKGIKDYKSKYLLFLLMLFLFY